MRRSLLLAVAGLALAATPAAATEHVVDMPGKFFAPASTTLLVGDTVTWRNSDAVGHDIAALGGAFESGLLGTGGRFSVSFQKSGHIAYRCTIHPFMAGSLDVYAFQLQGPTGMLSAGRRTVLRGLAPSGVTAVTIEQRRADGTWAPVITVPVGADGSFRASVVPTGPGVYRAVAAGDPSLPLRLPVGARIATSVHRLEHGRTAIRATARPAQAGAPAALQLYSRERYRWRQVAHARVDRHSRVSFVVSLPRRYAARIVLLKGRHGYGPSVGPLRHVGPPGASAPRGRRPRMEHGMHHH
jgi:plastocyanin